MQKFLTPLSARIVRRPATARGDRQGARGSVRVCCCSTSLCRRSTPRSADPWSRRSPACIADLPGLTILDATHDQSEALTLADRISVMNESRLIDVGSAQSLYRQPPSRFTASFVGNANVLTVTVERCDESRQEAVVRLGSSTLTVAAFGPARPGDSRMLCIRPHALALERTNGSDNAVEGTVTDVQWRGSVHRVYVDVEGAEMCADSRPLRDPPARGQRVALHFAPHDATLLGASGGAAGGARGRPIPTRVGNRPAWRRCRWRSKRPIAGKGRACQSGSGALCPFSRLSRCSYYPLFFIVRQSFMGDAGSASLAAYRAMFSSALFHNALLRTIEIASLSTAGCLVVGLVLALILAFVPFPGSGFIARLIDTFIALPTFLVTLAFTFLYGSAGMLNTGLMEAFSLLAPPPVDFLDRPVGCGVGRGHRLHALHPAASARRLFAGSTPRPDRSGKRTRRTAVPHCPSGHPACRRSPHSLPAAACACC